MSPTWSLEKLFLAAEISQGADIRERKIEAELVFIADRSQGKAAILDTEAAAVPVVGGLHRRVLKKAEIRVKAQVGGAAESALVGLSVAEEYPELIEGLLCRRRRRVAGSQQIGIASPDGVGAEAIVHECRAGIDAARA